MAALRLLALISVCMCAMHARTCFSKPSAIDGTSTDADPGRQHSREMRAAIGSAGDGAGLTQVDLAVLMPQRDATSSAAASNGDGPFASSITDGSHARRQLPVVVDDAVVTGVATAAEARAFAATMAAHHLRSPGDAASAAWGPVGLGAARALLHGRRRPSANARCPRCTLVECQTTPTRPDFCSGHCKQRGRLFRCTTTGRVAGVCASGSEVTPDPDMPPDPLPPLRSIVVTARAPYLGCANITGVDTGCPAPGTAVLDPDGVQSTVVYSSCTQIRPNLKCAEQTRAPFYPFGYCNCEVEGPSGVPRTGPCLSSYVGGDTPEGGGIVDFEPGSREGLGGASTFVPVRITTETETDVRDTLVSGTTVNSFNVTRTEYGIREGVDPGTYSFDHGFLFTSGSRSGLIQIDVQIFEAGEGLAASLTEEEVYYENAYAY